MSVANSGPINVNLGKLAYRPSYAYSVMENCLPKVPTDVLRVIDEYLPYTYEKIEASLWGKITYVAIVLILALLTGAIPFLSPLYDCYLDRKFCASLKAGNIKGAQQAIKYGLFILNGWVHRVDLIQKLIDLDQWESVEFYLSQLNYSVDKNNSDYNNYREKCKRFYNNLTKKLTEEKQAKFSNLLTKYDMI